MYSSAIRINPNELLNASMPGETRAEARINGYEYPVLTLEKLATTDKAYLGVLVENELNVHSIRECQWGMALTCRFVGAHFQNNLFHPATLDRQDKYSE